MAKSIDIRLVSSADAEALAKYYKNNEAHFRPWEPLRDDAYYSVGMLSQRLADYESLHAECAAAHFVGIRAGEVVAHCSLSNVAYGPFRACYMGYGVSSEHQGTGAMTEVCKFAISHAFEELTLNRIMANYMPCNVRSARLLEKLGFQKEGLARKYRKSTGIGKITCSRL